MTEYDDGSVSEFCDPAKEKAPRLSAEEFEKLQALMGPDYGWIIIVKPPVPTSEIKT